jgi:hypothetical protein
MGLSMEFYAGDPKVIARAFSAYEFNALREHRAAAAYSDFSLHLAPSDLDLLTQEVSDALGCNCPDFWDCLSDPVGGNDNEYGAAVLSSECVALLGSISNEWLSEMTRAWMSRVAEAHEDPAIEATAETHAAIRGVAELCRFAENRGISVVFGWYL